MRSDPSPPPEGFTRAVVRSRVRYSETDHFGIAHHSSYVPWFEMGRIELLRQLGHDYAEVEASGHAFPLTEMHFRFDAPLRLDEEFTVEAAVLTIRNFRLTFATRILGPAERLVARAYSLHAMVDQSMRVCEIPQELRALLEPRLAPDAWLGRRFGPGR